MAPLILVVSVVTNAQNEMMTGFAGVVPMLLDTHAYLLADLLPQRGETEVVCTYFLVHVSRE